MKSNPLVSVIIPVFNGQKHIDETLASVFNQSYKNIEIIVVDDGSTDNTKDIVNSYQNVNYFFKKNGGDASARNFGVKKSKGEYISFLDADDWWFPKKTEAHVSFHLKNPDILYSQCLEIAFLYGIDKIPFWIRPELFITPHVGNLSTFFTHRSVFDKIGFFDKTIKYASDVDWITRSKDMKIKSKIINELLVKRRIHSSNISHDNINLNNKTLLSIMRKSIQRRRNLKEKEFESGKF